MGFLGKDFKMVEKQKARKESLPIYRGDSQPKCFNCGNHRHLKANCPHLKEKALSVGPYCFGCGMKGHRLKRYWILHSKLKPIVTKRKAASKSDQG